MWHTHSTVTGTATALGLNGKPAERKPSHDGLHSNGGREGDDDLLVDHYAKMESNSSPIKVKAEPGASPIMVKREPAVKESEKGAVEEVEELDDGMEEEVPVGSGKMVNGMSRHTFAESRCTKRKGKEEERY